LRRSVIISFCVLFLFTAPGRGRDLQKPGPVPHGVDTVLARRAWERSEKIWVSSKARDRAADMRLWARDALSWITRKQEEDSQIYFEEIGAACDTLSAAFSLNPLDPGILMDLARACLLQGTIEFAQKAVVCLEVALELDRGNPVLYRRLGEAHARIGNWQTAAGFFSKAWQTRVDFAFFYIQGSADSLEAFQILFQLGQAAVKSYQADRASQAFEQALKWTSQSERVRQVTEMLELIEWAQGDIRSRELFTEAERLQNSGRPTEAAERYLTVLERTRHEASRAWQETAYRLALLEHEYLPGTQYMRRQPKNSTGLDRMRQLVDLTSNEPDSAVSPYHEAYGVLLFNEAMKALNAHQETRAMQYLIQGVLTRSSAAGRCALELAKLTLHAPWEGFLWSVHALNDPCLTEEERRLLMLLCRNLSRRLHNPELSRYFHDGLKSGRLEEPEDLFRRILVVESFRSAYAVLDVRLGPWTSSAWNRTEASGREIRSLMETLTDEERSRVLRAMDAYYGDLKQETARRNWQIFSRPWRNP